MLDINQFSSKNDVKIIIGAGDQSYDGWFSTGKDTLSLLDERDWKDSFNKRKVDAFLSEHVWEHLTFDEGKSAAWYCYDALKDGGYIRVAVPDGYFPDEEYQNLVQIGGPGPLDHPAADHKIVYTYKTFIEVFESAGFSVDLLEYCDENGRFHHRQWSSVDGPIYRSLMNDHRNTHEKLGFTSLIIDAWKR